jgi:DNA repair protein RadC
MAHAAAIVGVELVDHFILGTPSRWVSLKERGIF